MFWDALKVVFGCFDVSDDTEYDDESADVGIPRVRTEDGDIQTWLDPLFYSWEEPYMDDFFEESDDRAYAYDRDLRKMKKVERLLNEQSEDGSWNSTDFFGLELKKEYDNKIIATAAAIAFLSIHNSDKSTEIEEAKRKGMNFLDNSDKNEDWSELIEQVKPQLKRIA